MFTSGGFLRALLVTLLAGILILAGLMRFTTVFDQDEVIDPADQAAQAKSALEAVRNRSGDDRRPASYDAVLAPLDKLLARARAMLQDVMYDPVGDYQKIFDIADPVISIATEAHRLAMTETGPLAKTFRFNQQKAEACRYLASAMWSRMTARQTQSAARPGGDPRPLPAQEVDAALRIVNAGLDADPENHLLYYMRAVINRDGGMFASAARDLEKALEIDPQDADIWNVLGLVRINLKLFDKAEEALERARALLAAQAGENRTTPGADYTAVVFNLARFHESLAVFYARENRVSPSPENGRMTARHSAAARTYFQEFLDREPADAPDARLARRQLDGLPE